MAAFDQLLDPKPQSFSLQNLRLKMAPIGGEQKMPLSYNFSAYRSCFEASSSSRCVARDLCNKQSKSYGFLVKILPFIWCVLLLKLSVCTYEIGVLGGYALKQENSLIPPWRGNCPSFFNSESSPSGFSSASSLLAQPNANGKVLQAIFFAHTPEHCALECNSLSLNGKNALKSQKNDVFSLFKTSKTCVQFIFKGNQCFLFASDDATHTKREELDSSFFLSSSKKNDKLPFFHENGENLPLDLLESMVLDNTQYASGFAPIKLFGSDCSTSCQVSDWTEWIEADCLKEGEKLHTQEVGHYYSYDYRGVEGGLIEKKRHTHLSNNQQRRMRHILQGPKFAGESCPHLVEYQACTKGEMGRNCVLVDIVALGWGCTIDEEEIGGRRGFSAVRKEVVDSWHECHRICQSSLDCSFFTFGDFCGSLTGNCGYGGVDEAFNCVLVYGEPGCLLQVEGFIAGKKSEGENLSLCPKDCQASEWAEWSACASRGALTIGRRERQRSLISREKYRGKECVLYESEECLLKTQEGSGKLSEGNCVPSKTINQSMLENEQEHLKEREGRNVTPSLISCKFSDWQLECEAQEWSEWSKCEEEGGGVPLCTAELSHTYTKPIGKKYRKRIVRADSENLNFISSIESRPCSISPMERSKACKHAEALNCKFGDWTDWSPCSSDCKQYRFRQLLAKPPLPSIRRVLPCSQSDVEERECRGKCEKLSMKKYLSLSMGFLEDSEIFSFTSGGKEFSHQPTPPAAHYTFASLLAATFFAASTTVIFGAAATYYLKSTRKSYFRIYNDSEVVSDESLESFTAKSSPNEAIKGYFLSSENAVEQRGAESPITALELCKELNEPEDLLVGSVLDTNFWDSVDEEVAQKPPKS